jgi:ABC-type molybdate transport system substrate-binding protein
MAQPFPETFVLTQTPIGIVVRNGDPNHIDSLADPVQKGIHIGLCDAAQSTLGFLTRRMLKSAGLWDRLPHHVVYEAPNGGLLGVRMQRRALDAAIVYGVKVHGAGADLEFVPVANSGTKAVQAFTVEENSPLRQVCLRSLAFLKLDCGFFGRAGFLRRGERGAFESKSINADAM